MIRQGLILASLVGGLLVSGGSAFAATNSIYTAAVDDDNRKIVLICGDDVVVAHGDVEQKNLTILHLDLRNGLLAGILGATGSGEYRKCEFV
ncbi:hypothetical protein ETD86_14705 [Nonomuraea turkmeniaca]|uniref:Uncharacterized protein n=1 Tax=Nonomuraea turkmeniaca TaxID=103838 RepID=A0A5S4FM93_9ACTN|nr:hypothetical protein [Nonomuraea turkmeniaca]TMR21554.1 hypothetical protein ETD86_14705 [Nonomuraea turkmeniaca]